MPLVKALNTINILEISVLVFPFCNNGNTGRIHSVFEHSLNIAINGHLMHISSRQGFISGFGITILRNDFDILRRCVRVQDVVVLKKESFMIYSQSGVFKFVGGITRNLEAKPLQWKYNKDDLDILCQCFRDVLDARVLGLGSVAELEKVKQLLVMQKCSKEAFGQMVTFLTGRGLGLTPSGDDILLGYCFGLMIFDKGFVREFLEAYLLFIDSHTTKISYEYLYALAKRRISSPLLVLKNAIESRVIKDIELATSAIATIGHTSGNDCLFGILLALEYIQMNSE